MNLFAAFGSRLARRPAPTARRAAASVERFLDRALRSPADAQEPADECGWHDSSWALAGGLEVTELDADAWPLGAVTASGPAALAAAGA